MSKFTLTLANGDTRDYSRKIDAIRAGEKSDAGFVLTNPKGEVIMDTRPAAPEPKKATKSKATKAKADKPAPKRDARTWDATADGATHKCAGACGEVKPASAFPTTKVAGQRGVECRQCRDARLGKK